MAIERRSGWGWLVQRAWVRMRVAQWQQQEEDILERLLARAATEAVRCTGAGRLCERGSGRSIGEAVVSPVPR